MASDAAEFGRRMLRIAGVFKEFSRTNNPALVKLVMRHYGVAIIPLISLADGGRDRGRFVGLLRQLGVPLPETLVRDKALLGGELGKFDSKEYNAGIREGLSVRRTRISAELDMQMTRVSHQKMYPRVRDLKLLHQQVLGLIQAGIGRGNSSGGNK